MQCPRCGKEIELEVCECGFNFNETLSCPYLISNACVHTQKQCNVYGLGFEDCSLYLHKAGIEK